MPRCHANGIEIEYETFGSSADPAMLLVMGLRMQMLGWEPEFCQRIADHGFHVIRFDNRDIGLSTHFDRAPVADPAAVLGGDLSQVPYMLSDMAEDTAGLISALGVEAAHLVGASMGGMIVQELLLRHPERVLSACSIMSTTGDRSVGRPTPEGAAVLVNPPAFERDSSIERGVQIWRVLQSPAYPRTDEQLRTMEAGFYDRAHYPAGAARQLMASLAAPDRTAGLGSVTVPVLVIHGELDPLIGVSGGRATAAAVPGSVLRVYPGMGHDLPRQLWDEFVDEIVANTKRR